MEKGSSVASAGWKTRSPEKKEVGNVQKTAQCSLHALFYLSDSSLACYLKFSVHVIGILN